MWHYLSIKIFPEDRWTIINPQAFMKRADDKMSFYKWLNSIIPAKLKFCLLAMEIIVHNLNESFLPAIACTRRLLTSHRIWCLRNFQRNYRSELMDKHKAQVRVRTYVHANVPRLDWGSCPFDRGGHD